MCCTTCLVNTVRHFTLSGKQKKTLKARVPWFQELKAHSFSVGGTVLACAHIFLVASICTLDRRRARASSWKRNTSGRRTPTLLWRTQLQDYIVMRVELLSYLRMSARRSSSRKPVRGHAGSCGCRDCGKSTKC